MSLPDVIFRAYDIRGEVPGVLAIDHAPLLGKAFGLYCRQQGVTCVVVGLDGRLSSPALAEGVIQGLREAGLDVINLGLVATPQVYFMESQLDHGAGVMVTGSHNPPHHNGLKFVCRHKALAGAEIKSLQQLASHPLPSTPAGKIRPQSLDTYMAFLKETFYQRAGPQPLRVAWDAGSGMGGPIIDQLIQQLPGHHFPLYTQVDGTFPHHHPDPTRLENMQDLIACVQKNQCDVGLAFDGDADRLGVVLPSGHLLVGDQLLAFFAQEVGRAHPGALVVADIKVSRGALQQIKESGCSPVLCPTGHSHIKAKMRSENALLGGEVSGHLMFADEYKGFDDGPYAAVRLLRILSQDPQALSRFVQNWPPSHITPEIMVPCGEDLKFLISQRLADLLTQQGSPFNGMDGVRVDYPKGWWLVRPSNTQALLVIRLEGETQDVLSTLLAEVEKLLSQAGLSLSLEGYL
jgi:phosphomannomutase